MLLAMATGISVFRMPFQKDHVLFRIEYLRESRLLGIQVHLHLLLATGRPSSDIPSLLSGLYVFVSNGSAPYPRTSPGDLHRVPDTRYRIAETGTL